MLNVRCFHWVIVATILVVTASVVAFPQILYVKVDVLNAREIRSGCAGGIQVKQRLR